MFIFQIHPTLQAAGNSNLKIHAGGTLFQVRHKSIIVENDAFEPLVLL
jgi:hypothetical protein